MDDMIAYWAYYDGKSLQKICPAECIYISSKEPKKYTIGINTFSNLPMLEISTLETKEITLNGRKYELSPSGGKESIILKNVQYGSYSLLNYFDKP